MRLYAMLDDPEIHDSPKEVGVEEAKALNQKGYGIFHAVNEFNGPRKKENLVRIKYWYMEFDGGNKERQLQRLHKMDIVPTKLVESKNGYHCYFAAVDAKVEHYEEIQSRMGYWCGADRKVKDLARILRTPGFYHWKDKDDPFQVKLVWNHDCRYQESSMLYAFPPIPEEEETSSPYQMEGGLRDKKLKFNEDTDFFDRLFDCNQIELLTRLSGTSYVNGEIYRFHPVSDGKYNIFVNGKGTSCFIDENKRIGASSGPTIWGWLHWYGHKHKDIYRIIKQEFPELCL